MMPWDVNSFSQHLLLNSDISHEKIRGLTTQTTVSPTQGFHIVTTTTISGLDTFVPEANCFAGSLQFVPPDFIIDEYELRQRYEEGYGPLCHVIGERDLELPVQGIGGRPAAILAEKGGGLSELQLPWPWVVVTCGHTVNQVGRELLDQVFNNKTISSHYALLAPGTPHPSATILVPTGSTSHQLWVETVTLLSVFSAFAYIALRLLQHHLVTNTKLKKS
ncbi:unnamed protein product [Rhizoctonia solani]|uniref:Protein PBN1 n=1 Tax=Rhizoctonia solani TaxID=456999 RepID=A0A8H3BNQ6_9AGAM|nr:unnamed protein product [Rhizoctonia solani]